MSAPPTRRAVCRSPTTTPRWSGPAKVRVRYIDYDGRLQEREVDGLLATCVQHEIDHLNGILFIDYISKLKRDLVVKKFTKAAREKERQRQHRI